MTAPQLEGAGRFIGFQPQGRGLFRGEALEEFTGLSNPEAYTVAEPLEPGISGRARCPHVWKVSKIPGKTREGAKVSSFGDWKHVHWRFVWWFDTCFFLQFLPFKPQQLGNKHVIQFDLEAYFCSKRGKHQPGNHH